jgi:hypothetical protein
MSAMLIIGCSDSGTGNDPANDPVLAVSQTELNLSGSPRWDRFDLMNSGGGQVEWIIEETPEWLEVSEKSGIGLTSTDTTTIRITTHLEQLDYGVYNGEIKISSNAGSVTIVVNLEYRAPQLKLEPEIINMDRHYQFSELTLINEGGGELIWQIDYAPSWLEFSMDSGAVYSQPAIVPYRARIDNIDYGQYSDKVIVTSNGGDYEINVYLSYEREVEVFAGIGAAGVELGDTYLMVEKLLGKPTHSGYQRPEKTVFIHNVNYDNIGVEFRIKNSSPILFGTGEVGYIRMTFPYDGLTPEQIGLQSTSAELVAAVGEPLEKDGPEWIYEGITYMIRNDRVAEMLIKDPDF